MTFLQRISAILLSALQFLTLPLSFLPGRISTDFTVPEMSIACSEEGNAQVYSFEGNRAWFNYYGLRYRSNAYLRGTLTYGNGLRTRSEDFFLEPSEDGEFYSFLDGYLNREKSNTVSAVTLTPLSGDAPSFALTGFATFNRSVAKREVTVETESMKYGIDLQWGGALSILEDLDSNVEAVQKDGKIYVDSDASTRYGGKVISRNVNLINRFDAGRLVQQSYYGTVDAPYEPGVYMDNVWHYNPVQGGNQFNDSSKIVDFRQEGDSLYLKCRPMDWAKDKSCITPSYMEATYTAVGNVLKVDCRFTDFSGYPEFYGSQELPAFYCVEPLNRFVYSDNGIHSVDNLGFWAEEGYPKFTSPDHWSAFVGEAEDSFGIGLFVPTQTVFLTGVYGRGKTAGKDISTSGSTSYIAAVSERLFRSFDPFSYTYYIATGTTQELGATFSALNTD